MSGFNRQALGRTLLAGVTAVILTGAFFGTAVAQSSTGGKPTAAEWVCVVSVQNRKGVTYMNTIMVDVESKKAAASHMDKMPDDAELLEFVEKQVYLTLASLKAAAK